MPERRAAQQNFWPAACGELQAAAKPRTVGRVSGGQFARSLRRSRVHAQYRARAAWPASSGRVNRPPGADWVPLVAPPPATRQLPRGQRRCPRRSGRPHWERARARACRLAAGASRPSRAERRRWSSKIQLARALSPPHLIGAAGAWREGGRPARRVWPRGSRTRPPGRAAGPPRRRRLRRGARPLPPTRIGVAVRRLPASAAAVSASQVAGRRGAARRAMMHLSGVCTATPGRCRSSDNAAVGFSRRAQ